MPTDTNNVAADDGSANPTTIARRIDVYAMSRTSLFGLELEKVYHDHSTVCYYFFEMLPAPLVYFLGLLGRSADLAVPILLIVSVIIFAGFSISEMTMQSDNRRIYNEIQSWGEIGRAAVRQAVFGVGGGIILILWLVGGLFSLGWAAWEDHQQLLFEASNAHNNVEPLVDRRDIVASSPPMAKIARGLSADVKACIAAQGHSYFPVLKETGEALYHKVRDIELEIGAQCMRQLGTDLFALQRDLADANLLNPDLDTAYQRARSLPDSNTLTILANRLEEITTNAEPTQE